MFAMMAAMRSAGEMKCQIQTVCWNRIQLYQKKESDLGSFTTTKVTADMLGHLNTQLYELAKNARASGLFLHGDSPSLSDFRQSATCMIRCFPDTCAYPANAMGIPYCRMQQGTVELPKSGTSFSMKADQIDSCVDSIAELLQRFSAVEVDA